MRFEALPRMQGPWRKPDKATAYIMIGLLPKPRRR